MQPENVLTLAEVEKNHILKIFTQFEGNRTKSALALGISIRTLRNKLKRYLAQSQQSA